MVECESDCIRDYKLKEINISNLFYLWEKQRRKIATRRTLQINDGQNKYMNYVRKSRNDGRISALRCWFSDSKISFRKNFV